MRNATHVSQPSSYAGFSHLASRSAVRCKTSCLLRAHEAAWINGVARISKLPIVCTIHGIALAENQRRPPARTLRYRVLALGHMESRRLSGVIRGTSRTPKWFRIESARSRIPMKRRICSVTGARGIPRRSRQGAFTQTRPSIVVSATDARPRRMRVRPIRPYVLKRYTP